METNNQRIERLKFTASGFDRIENDTIDKYFSIKFETWLFRNSDEAEITNEDKRLRPNMEGTTLTNVKSSKKIKGIDLTQDDFISSELKAINRIDENLLSVENKKQIDFYKNYLEAKKLGISVTSHPEIFTSNKAYQVFLDLVEKFGKVKTPLANYSYVYNAMVKKKLIDNTKPLNDYFHLLSKFDINIKEIKGGHKLTSQTKKNTIQEVFRKYDIQ